MPAFDYLSPEQQAQAYHLYEKYMKERKKKRRHRMALAGVIGANIAGASLAVKKSAPLTDSQIRAKKKRQAKISTAGSYAGLTGLAGLAGASAIRKYPNAFKKVPVLSRKIATQGSHEVANSVKDKSYIAGAISTGIGGVGGLNFAAIQRAESKRKKINQ